jgi:4-hydroxymandelate oxidase
VKPFKNRDKIFGILDDLLGQGVTWVGIELDAAQGTKIGDKEMGFECSPLSLKEIREIKKRVPVPLACKGVLSREDAEKCVEAGADIIVVSSHGGHYPIHFRSWTRSSKPLRARSKS